MGPCTAISTPASRISNAAGEKWGMEHSAEVELGTRRGGARSGAELHIHPINSTAQPAVECNDPPFVAAENPAIGPHPCVEDRPANEILDLLQSQLVSAKKYRGRECGDRTVLLELFPPRRHARRERRIIEQAFESLCVADVQTHDLIALRVIDITHGNVEIPHGSKGEFPAAGFVEERAESRVAVDVV